MDQPQELQQWPQVGQWVAIVRATKEGEWPRSATTRESVELGGVVAYERTSVETVSVVNAEEVMRTFERSPGGMFRETGVPFAEAGTLMQLSSAKVIALRSARVLQGVMAYVAGIDATRTDVSAAFKGIEDRLTLARTVLARISTGEA